MPQMDSWPSGRIGFGPPDWLRKTKAAFTSVGRNSRHPSARGLRALRLEGERDLSPRRLGPPTMRRHLVGNDGTGLAEAVPGLAGLRTLAVAEGPDEPRVNEAPPSWAGASVPNSCRGAIGVDARGLGVVGLCGSTDRVRRRVGGSGSALRRRLDPRRIKASRLSRTLSVDRGMIRGERRPQSLPRHTPRKRPSSNPPKKPPEREGRP
jgi:hypothetical protein